MNISIRSLTLTLALAAAVLGATAAQAQTTVITTLPYTINSPGTYVLNNNLNSSQTIGTLITISASNVTLDFQGHYIAAAVNNTNQTTNGINAYEQSNLTIKNGTIAFCSLGINIQGNGNANTNSVGHRVDNMRVTYCYSSGIFFIGCPASRITNCQVSQSGFSGATVAYGIYASGAGITVSGCAVSTVTATTSIGIFASTGSFMRRNTVSNCGYGLYGGKYQDNLTANCTTPYAAGTDAGGNN